MSSLFNIFLETYVRYLDRGNFYTFHNLADFLMQRLFKKAYYTNEIYVKKSGALQFFIYRKGQGSSKMEKK